MEKECQHPQWENRKHSRLFQGEEFVFRANTCLSCESVLWDNECEKKYNKWINELYSNTKQRHLFQIQYSISENAQKCIGKLSERFSGVKESLLIRALVITYIAKVDPIPEIESKIDEYSKEEDYSILIGGPKIHKKLQFNPGGLKDILTLSDMLGVGPRTIVEESLFRMLLLSIKEDPEMRDFWENIIIKGLEIILKAA